MERSAIEGQPAIRSGVAVPGFEGRQSSAGRLVLAAIAVLAALALGVWLMQGRGGIADGEAGGLPPRSAEVEAFVSLSHEATAEARAVMPDAELYFIAMGAGGVYTFRFSEPGSRREMAVAGPYVNDPAFPRWEVFPDQERRAIDPSPEPLDLSFLRHTPEQFAEFVYQAVVLRTGAHLQARGGHLVWRGTFLGRTAVETTCEAPDADLTRLVCDGPLPFP